MNRFLAIALCVASATVPLSLFCYAQPSGQQTQPSAAPGTANRRIGAIKAISGTAITLTPDSGPDVNITVQPATRIVRIAPGEKDLKLDVYKRQVLAEVFQKPFRSDQQLAAQRKHCIPFENHAFSLDLAPQFSTALRDLTCVHPGFSQSLSPVRRQ